jgi:hypothetical protein
MNVCKKQKAAKQSSPATPLVIILQQLQQTNMLAQPLLHAAKHVTLHPTAPFKSMNVIRTYVAKIWESTL